MTLKRLLLTIVLLGLPSLFILADAETVKVRKAVGRWEVSHDITMAQAEEKALNEAKKDALRKAGVMEKVWSVFGQVTSDQGSQFAEAYSSVSVLAIDGMVNVTSQKTEELWDENLKKLFKVVTIDATVTKSDIKEDQTYALKVDGIAPIYKNGELFQCSFKVFGTDSYIKLFWFGDDGAAMVYPNDYEGDLLFTAGKEYHFPLTEQIDLAMEKKEGTDVERVNIILVATKKAYPYLGEMDYQSILSWIYGLPADQRTLSYHLTLIK